MKQKDNWKLIGHSHQIADTGDYSGHWEITNGEISIITQNDEEEEVLKPIVDALNNSGCNFYIEKDLQYEVDILKKDNARLHKEVEAKKSAYGLKPISKNVFVSWMDKQSESSIRRNRWVNGYKGDGSENFWQWEVPGVDGIMPTINL
jgi:hypothetical protein